MHFFPCWISCFSLKCFILQKWMVCECHFMLTLKEKNILESVLMRSHQPCSLQIWKQCKHPRVLGLSEHVVKKKKTQLSAPNLMLNSWYVILGNLPWFALRLVNYPVFLLTFIPVLNYDYTFHSLTWEISLPEIRPLGTFSCQPNLTGLHPFIHLSLSTSVRSVYWCRSTHYQI